VLTDVMRHLLDELEPQVVDEAIDRCLRDMEKTPNPSSARMLLGYASWHLYRDRPMPLGLRAYLAGVLR